MKVSFCECSECGSEKARVEDNPDGYEVLYECPDCGYEGADGYEDLYGA